MMRLAGRTLMVSQAVLFVLSLYWIIDAYVTHYQSEWLTGDVLVPYFILIGCLSALCLFLTRRIMRSTHRLVWLWLIPIAVITYLPIIGFIVDVFALG